MKTKINTHKKQKNKQTYTYKKTQKIISSTIILWDDYGMAPTEGRSPYLCNMNTFTLHQPNTE